MFNKCDLIVVGILLVVLFGGAVWLVGMKMNDTTNQMHGSLVKEVGKYRAELIALDFERTVSLAESILAYMEENPLCENELQSRLKSFVRMDAKVSRIWYRQGESIFVGIDSAGQVIADQEVQKVWSAVSRRATREVSDTLYVGNGVLYLSFCARSGDFVLGLDLSLAELHDYFARMSPSGREYAYVLDSRGVVIVHPEEQFIGKTVDKDGWELFRQALEQNAAVQDNTHSDYLSLPVMRVYYPIRVGERRWVVAVNSLELVKQEEMAGFHRYALSIVGLTVFFFSILLLFSKYKWRKEYDRRMQLEQEALQLNLQQLKNQINPHFLFNALNSLNALIGSQPALAKEFVVKLSRIYRYVLEKRRDSLVPVREEMELIHHYYFLQKIRFGESLCLEIAEGVEEEERMIPLMSLQLLLENAVKHNEISRRNPLEIVIRLEGEVLVVENTYRPRTDMSGESMGVGLENIREIYAFCTDKHFTCRGENGRFVCRLPLI